MGSNRSPHRESKAKVYRSMFLLLMQTRLRSVRNQILDTLRRHPLLAVGLGLLSTGFFVGVYSFFSVFFGIAEKLNALQETIYQVFYFLFLFLLAGAVPFVASTLLHSADYSLLFAAPVPPRSVIAAKLLDSTVANSLQFAILGVPAMAACAVAVGLPLWGWLLVPPLIALFALLPALITSLGLLLALAAFGMRRLRAAITFINAITGAVVCITIVSEIGHQGLGQAGIGSLLTHTDRLIATSPTAHCMPSAWFAAILLAMARGDTGVFFMAAARILLVIGLLYGLCMLLGARLLSAAHVAEENEDAPRDTRNSKGTVNAWHLLFASPIAATIHKDLKYVRRDSVLLSQLAMPLILFIVPFLLSLQSPSLRDIMFPFASVMVGVILFMQTSILSLSSIGLENRSFWVTLVSPVSGKTLLLAKFVMSSLVSAGVGVALTFLSGALFNATLQTLLIQSGLVILSAAALCGMGVGISAIFPRFVYENPAHRVSAWALILGFFASIAYLLATGILFGLAWLLVLNGALGLAPTVIFGSSVALYIALTLFAIYLPLNLGAHRIEAYQWEH
jgi:ABC-2 type transport system permease protein